MGWPGPLTHLQFLAWQAWMVDDLWLPDRHDLYAMQLTQEVHALPSRIFEGKYPDEVKLTDFRLCPKEQRQGSGGGGEINGSGKHKIGSQDGIGNVPVPSSQEDTRPLHPGLPPVVTEQNKAAIQAKIAKAYRDYQAKLEQQGKLRRPDPRPDPEQLS